MYLNDFSDGCGTRMTEARSMKFLASMVIVLYSFFENYKILLIDFLVKGQKFNLKIGAVGTLGFPLIAAWSEFKTF